MLCKNQIHSRKEDKPSYRYLPFRVICGRVGSAMHVLAILVICVVVASLFPPAVSQSKDTTSRSCRPVPYIPDAFCQSSGVFKGYGDGTPSSNKFYFNITIDGSVTHGLNEAVGGVPFRFDEGTVMPRGMFEVNPSLFLNGKGRDSQYPASFKIAFFIDDDLKGHQDETEIIESRSLVDKMLISERLKTLTEIPVRQFSVSLPQERKTYNPSHDALSDRLAAPPESPEEPALQRSYRIPGIDPVEKGYGEYDKNSEMKEGGNIKLPLPVRGLREEKDHMGIFPDAIYVGTDFDYRGIAQSLTSWRSENGTLSSDLNRIGSEWMDTRSGYIYFEWQLWE